MPGLYGSLLVMMTKNNPKFGLFYLAIAAVLYFVAQWIGSKVYILSTMGLAMVMGLTILIGYIRFQRENK